MTESAYYPDINRAALIIKLRKPFIDWLVYTSKEYDDEDMKPEEVETEGSDSKQVYLIPAHEYTEQCEKFLRKHCTEIFEQELSGWYTDPAMWPQARSWKIFQQWFDYEIQTMVLDMTPNKPIEHAE